MVYLGIASETWGVDSCHQAKSIELSQKYFGEVWETACGVHELLKWLRYITWELPSMMYLHT